MISLKNFMTKYILYKSRDMFVIVGSQADVGSSKDGSDGEAECSDGEADSEIVRDKIAELNRMKAQLARLKGIMSAVQNIEGSDGTIQVRERADVHGRENRKCNITV